MWVGRRGVTDYMAIIAFIVLRLCATTEAIIISLPLSRGDTHLCFEGY